MGRFQGLGLPLLAKELVELSARPRTYLVRVIYAGLLLLISCFVLLSLLPGNLSTRTNFLGIGWPLMVWLAYLQRTGLHLVLPVLVCGAFTIEKERNTLGLLFLTRLGALDDCVRKIPRERAAGLQLPDHFAAGPRVRLLAGRDHD